MKHRLNPEVITTVGLWCENHKSQAVICDIPLRMHKYNIINRFPLLELEKMY